MAAAPICTLTHATPAQVEQQNRANAAEWRGPLPVGAYLRRELHLAGAGSSAGGGIQPWVLVDDAGKVLAGCDTFFKRALVSRGGRVEACTAQGVGSVFVPPAGRGKGAGSLMMARLGDALGDASWQGKHGAKGKEACLFSVLFSDIGKTFYAKHGWKPYESSHVHLPPVQAPDANVKLLYTEDLPELCTRDEALIRQRLAAQKGTAVALLPDYDTLIWQHAREEFVSNEILHKTPKVKGALASVGNVTVWAVFSRVWANENIQEHKGNILHILRLAVDGDGADDDAIVAATAQVLKAAQHEAYEWGMEAVELWNPSGHSLAAAQHLQPGVQVEHEEKESIRCLRWNGEGGLDAEVAWLENEKFSWC